MLDYDQNAQKFILQISNIIIFATEKYCKSEINLEKEKDLILWIFNHFIPNILKKWRKETLPEEFLAHFITKYHRFFNTDEMIYIQREIDKQIDRQMDIEIEIIQERESE